MLDRIIRNVRLPGQDGKHDIGIAGSRIAAIGADLPAAAAPAEDFDGCLVLPGFVETHVHLDKACLLARMGDGAETLAGAIAKVSAMKRNFTVEDVYARGRRVLEMAIGQGTNVMRTHVEIDPVIGLRGFEAVLSLKRDFAFAIDLEICVFPQEGLTNRPGTDALLLEALSRGADLLGGCPYTDSDPAAQIAWCFAQAVAHDVDLDFHLDFDLDPSRMGLDEVIRQTEAHGWGGRVTVGHVTKLSMLEGEALDGIAARLAGAGVGVTVLPSTDLYLMGDGMGPQRPRGVTPAHRLSAAGVTCSISTNNLLNPFTPFGDGSLPRIANLFANIHGIGDRHGLCACAAMIGDDARRLLGRAGQAIAAGAPATFICVPAEDEAMAIAEIARPVAGFKDGRRTFTATRPVIHRP